MVWAPPGDGVSQIAAAEPWDWTTRPLGHAVDLTAGRTGRRRGRWMSSAMDQDALTTNTARIMSLFHGLAPLLAAVPRRRRRGPERPPTTVGDLVLDDIDVLVSVRDSWAGLDRPDVLLGDAQPLDEAQRPDRTRRSAGPR